MLKTLDKRGKIWYNHAMELIKTTNEIISANLVKLRKQNKLTQAELAEKIHYSDKSISKWEKGESCPSISVAIEIANFYGLTLNDLVDPELKTDEIAIPQKKPQNYSYLVITLLACSVVWLVATIVFIYGTLISADGAPWLSFIYAIPLTCIVLIIFNSLWGNRRLNYLIISIFTWTLLLSIFLGVMVMSHYAYVLWSIFILGIPIQISTILWSQLKRREKANEHNKNHEKSRTRRSTVPIEIPTLFDPDENKNV